MLIDEKAEWNKRYSEHSHSSLEPDPLLENAHREFLSQTAPGIALDVAGGVGRHAIWLAERGWRVRLFDISEVGIEQARNNASTLGAAAESLITAEVRDLNSVTDLGHEEYDLVLVFYYLQRELFPALISALRPGGILIYKTYTTEQRRFSGGPSKTGPSHPMFLLEPNELLRAFPPLRILDYHETIAEKGVAELVGKKLADSH
jgi:tellurite methyltransferase